MLTKQFCIKSAIKLKRPEVFHRLWLWMINCRWNIKEAIQAAKLKVALMEQIKDDIWTLLPSAYLEMYELLKLSKVPRQTWCKGILWNIYISYVQVLQWIFYEVFLINVFSVEGIDVRGPQSFCGRLIWFQPFSPLSYNSTFLISPRIFFLSMCAFLFEYISWMILKVCTLYRSRIHEYTTFWGFWA